MNALEEFKLKDYFSERENFSRLELLDFYKKFEPDIKIGTFSWRIYNLKKKNIIRQVKKSLYALAEKEQFLPSIEKSLQKIALEIMESFHSVNFCVWNTSVFNIFSQLQITKFINIIEVEKEFSESVFHYLIDNNIKNVFMNIAVSDIDLYTSSLQTPILIKPMISRAPLIKIELNENKIYYPALEKLLVDLVCKEPLLEYFGKSDFEYIYKRTMQRYNIDFTKLLQYAKRRNRKNEVIGFIPNNIKNSVFKEVAL